jgi:hypothetical protein
MEITMCAHESQCPSAGDTACAAARVIASHPEQGWSLLCNGIVFFDDGGLILPDGRAAAPHTRPCTSGARLGKKPGRAVNRSADGRRRSANRGPHVASRC